MKKLFFQVPNCEGATSGASGRTYDSDSQGFIHVSSEADAKFLKANGYLEAGGMPKLKKYWVCVCGWEASISHCPKCDRDDLEKVER